MRSISLPVSKSIANRILMLQAMHGDSLLEITPAMPEDCVILHRSLLQLQSESSPQRLDLGNCGTAMRFLTAYCAQLAGCDVILDGVERMHHRPIGQLVDALRTCGAQIDYMDQSGFPPLHIHGRELISPLSPTMQHPGITLIDPVSTQFVSALLLIGMEVESNHDSPYITMTRELIRRYAQGQRWTVDSIERDWSAAAFWYEYVALHGGEMRLEGLSPHSLQGDSVVARLFRRLGVDTYDEKTGVRIARTHKTNRWPCVMNFAQCPDLYPPLAITCQMLHKPLWALGTESLIYKESNRLQSVRQKRDHHDHRMAMALLAADMVCEHPECIRKSYPQFIEQLCP